MLIGSTKLAFTSWVFDPSDPAAERARSLAAIRALVVDHGAQVVELTGDLALLYPGIFTPAYYEQVAALKADLQFELTAHLPILWADLGAMNKLAWRASVDSYLRVIETVRPCAPLNYVLHPWGGQTGFLASMPDIGPQFRPRLLDQVKRGLEVILRRIPAEKLCIENLRHMSFDVSWPLVEHFDTRVCFDVGHQQVLEEPIFEFLEAHHARIGEVHIHDVIELPDGRLRDHQALGEGMIDYARLMGRFSELLNGVPVVVENITGPDAVRSLGALARWRV